MKYPHTGLYHFCLQLGQALNKNIDTHKHLLTYYVRKPEFGIFGNEVAYLEQNSLHKFLLPSTNNYDLWHATYQATQYFPQNRKIKIVLTVHDLNFLHEKTKSAEKQKKELKKLQEKINRADHIVAISQFVLNDIKQNIQLKGQPITVIYNGCNINEIKNTKRPLAAPNGKYIYTIGTITDKKNFHVLPALLNSNNLYLVISGITQNQEYLNKIINQAKQHGVEKRLIFTGAVTEEDKQWYMRNCEVFVFPSLAEGFGLPVIEAMYFGKPVILSNYTSLPEIGGNDAYYFDSFEPEEMQKVLNSCLISFDKEIAERVKKRAALFNWNDTAKLYENIYANVSNV
jgi:glycosyltransferase involved in cell wall biosynthesis